MYHAYFWRMVFHESGEILQGSRLYTSDSRANTYLYQYLYNHHAKIRDAACTELTVERDDGHLLYDVVGDVYETKEV